MSDDTTPRLERMLEATARKVSGGSLHPLEILQKVREAVERSARDKVVANDVVVSFSPGDYERYHPALASLAREITAMLDMVERERQYSRVGDRRVRFETSSASVEGMVRVVARFVDTSHAEMASLAGATRRITRQRGLTLVVGDGQRIAVTHTPFSIGRGPGNDLAVASLAVSRRHAELLFTPAGLILRDLGSRNGLVVEGVRVDEVALEPGLLVLLGDVGLQLEVAS